MVVKVLVGVAIALLLGALGATLVGSWLWDRSTRRQAGRLVDGAASTPPPAAGDGAAPLPEPVARFLARATPADGRTIRVARLEQEGHFLMREPDGWSPFDATQWFRAHPPAFLWSARVRMAPLVPVRVRDAYVDGQGSMHGAIAGLVTVVRAGGTAEMASGSLYRYLAEAAWQPTRLRPSGTLRWTARDETRAIATLSDAGTTVEVEFRFDAAGDIVGIHVPERAREVDGGFELAPWIGRFWEHRDVQGVRIPMRGEVAWFVDGEERPYWRGRVVDVRFELDAPP